jgi:molybdenum cofactor biosynthesis protein B
VSAGEHKAQAPRQPIGCYVLTVSDTRTPETDTSGRAIRDLFVEAGHQVIGFSIVRDEPDQVTATIQAQLADADTRVIVTTGGTGITSRDGTFEAVDRLLEKRLDGFGELFRMLSYEDIKAAAMRHRRHRRAEGHLRAPWIRERRAIGDVETDRARASTRDAATG